MVVSGCPKRRESFFFPFRSGRLGKGGFVPHSVGGSMWFLVHLFVCVRAGTSCRVAYWRAVLATAIAPLMKPWCAEEEVPTAANLNLYRGGNSCVGLALR